MKSNILVNYEFLDESGVHVFCLVFCYDIYLFKTFDF